MSVLLCNDLVTQVTAVLVSRMLDIWADTAVVTLGNTELGTRDTTRLEPSRHGSSFVTLLLDWWSYSGPRCLTGWLYTCTPVLVLLSTTYICPGSAEQSWCPVVCRAGWCVVTSHMGTEKEEILVSNIDITCWWVGLSCCLISL